MSHRRYSDPNGTRPVYWAGGCGATGITLSGSLQTLTLNNEDESSGAADFSLASNVLTVTEPGLYDIRALMMYDKTTSDAWSEVQTLMKHNAAYPSRTSGNTTFRNSGTSISYTIGRIRTLAAGDTLEFQARILSGANIDQAGQGLVLSLHRIAVA